MRFRDERGCCFAGYSSNDDSYPADKTESTQKILEQHPPDLFWCVRSAFVSVTLPRVDDEDRRDNVGGETLDIVYNTIKQKGRIIACGAISQYNLPEEKKYGVKNTAAIVTKSLRHEGFIVSQFPQDEFNAKMPPLVKSGEIK